MRRSAHLAVLVAVGFAVGCGGGESGSGAADRLAATVLGGAPTDETRDDHDCVSDALDAAFPAAMLETLGEADDLADLDVPSRRRILNAALTCVPSTDLGG